jgi:hypothetical protein
MRRVYNPSPELAGRGIGVGPNGKPLRVIAVDVGMKYNQIRCFLKRGIQLEVVPYNYDFTQNEDSYDGIFIRYAPFFSHFFFSFFPPFFSLFFPVFFLFSFMFEPRSSRC